MKQSTKQLTSLVVLAAFTQTACYNSYFIDKTELEKLESSVEPQEVVEVYGDCPSSATADLRDFARPLYAQADTEPAADPASGASDDVDIPEIDEATDTATDAAPQTPAADPSAEAAPVNRTGCTKVEVSTGNAVQVVTKTGKERVTPFNFIMSGGQLVSPEYDLLVSLNDVDGAEVREFSTWKTVGTIVGVSAVAVGTFVAISIFAPESGGFQQ